MSVTRQGYANSPSRLRGELDQRLPEKDHIGKGESIDLKDVSGSETGPTPDGEEPNEYEKSTLRRIGDKLPASAFLIAVVELTERFTYYGAQGLFQNYISNSPDGSEGQKGLGMGHQAATGLNLYFQWFCYGMLRFW
jgi:proton-dependent oligopeptide transporter, POT family